MFTQPIMYKNIQKQEAITDMYAKKLLQEGVVNEEWIQVCTPNKFLLLIGTWSSNDALATRMSLKKWICVLSVFIAIIPTHLLCQMWANPPEVEFQGTISKVRKRNKISSLLVFFLQKRELRRFHVVIVQWRQRNVQKSVQSCWFSH